MSRIEGSHFIKRIQGTMGRVKSIQGSLGNQKNIQGEKGLALVQTVTLIKYGRLYNGYVVRDARPVLPEGWDIPNLQNVEDLADYILDNYNEAPNDYGVVLHLKHRRMNRSDALINTNIHPRWDSHANIGRDTLNFGMIPSGSRSNSTGAFQLLGSRSHVWLSNEIGNDQRQLYMTNTSTWWMTGWTSNVKSGLAIRGIRNATASELELEDGAFCDVAEDIDGNVYRTVKIDDKVWFVDLLATTRFRNGDHIPNITGNTEWTELTTPGRCNYGNDENNVFANYNWH